MTICYQLREWISMDRLDNDMLSCNPIITQSIDNDIATDLYLYNIAIDLNLYDWLDLSMNPAAIHLLEANPDKIDWTSLSLNPAAIHLLEANQDKIYWDWFSQNPAAIHLLEANPDKINWDCLSLNPAAIHLLEANPDKIDWTWISTNPAIFTYDYKKMNATKRKLNQEVLRNVLHLNRLVIPDLTNVILDYLH